MTKLYSTIHKYNLSQPRSSYSDLPAYFLLLYISYSGLYQLSLQANQYIT